MSDPLEASGPGAQAPALGPRAAEAVRRTRVRVRYAETDRMGVVYYANYLVWFEIGRTEWLRQTGWTYREMERDGISLPAIEAHCEYRQPARYDDEIEITTRGTLVTPVRIRFDYEVARGADGTIAAVGHTVHAAVDTSGKPCRLPSRVREMLA
ncbi:MAG: acyl-CoA thioesterase [Acidobacteria bacterium]|nr:acyl-CoA thioesterase [Acidobacteriota bacterium]